MNENKPVNDNTKVCVWEEISRKNVDLYWVECLNSQVNPWKTAKKKGITLVQLFTRCPFCGGIVSPKFTKQENNNEKRVAD